MRSRCMHDAWATMQKKKRWALLVLILGRQSTVPSNCEHISVRDKSQRTQHRLEKLVLQLDDTVWGSKSSSEQLRSPRALDITEVSQLITLVAALIQSSISLCSAVDQFIIASTCTGETKLKSYPYIWWMPVNKPAMHERWLWMRLRRW